MSFFARVLCIAPLVVTLACAGGAQKETSDAKPAAPDTRPFRLPTGVHLDPVGRSMAVGNMPLGMITSRDGQTIVVSLCGWREQGIQLVDRASGTVKQRLPQRGAFLGLALDGNGHTLYVSGGSAEVVYVYTWASTVALTDSIPLDRADSTVPHYPAGLALSPEGNRLYVAENLSDSLAVIDLVSRHIVQRLAVGPYPYNVVAADSSVYVSAWGAGYVASFVVDRAGVLHAQHPIDAGRHPSALLITRDGARLFAASASTDRVAVIDTRSGRVLQWLDDRPAGAAEGATPNALALSPDGRRLFVAEADANAVAMFELSAESSGDSTLGVARGADRLSARIPVEWYPCALVADRDSILVVNGKGRGTGPNPGFRQPGQKTLDRHGYTLGQLNGSVSVVPVPTSNTMMRNFSNQVGMANGWNPHAPLPKSQYPRFEHVVYIIKENRTFDQMLGDLPQADGDTSLMFFPRSVTPNHHALAERFGIFDRFFVNAEVSNQGHPWSTAAYVTDFLEKTTPDVYRGARAEHEPGDADDPAAGYVWDAAIQRGVSLRNYGEYSEAMSADAAGPARTRAGLPALAPYTHPTYPPFDMTIPDQRRADIWIAELGKFEKSGSMPQLEILHLPGDHTSGARKGQPTPRASVADNDLALGRIIDALSHSRFWRSTVVFVLEDDAQDGPDHVDSHRSVLLVASAWNRGGVFHRFVNTTDVLATIEEILGLDPMSQFDRYGRPLREIWSDHADETPYATLVPAQRIDQVNVADSRDARACAQMDLSHADRINDDELNRILWRALKGRRPYPAPARASLQEIVRAH